AGESQARNRYLRYAKAAKKEGYQYIASVFEETAREEVEHASRFFKFMDEGDCTPEIKVEWTFPTGHIGNTEENLRSAAAGEKFEFSDMYPKYADIAEKEGFSNIAHVWRMIAKAETWHHDRYLALAEQVADGTIHKKKEKVQWRCANCGYIHDGEHPPEKCPACDHPKGYFFPHVFM
ncbi:MAG: rubrerythrin family protein, partial [Candidatus Thorarchaeota archaeon]|nr:rubrerythrin family protein [Candidatus Thorarchaeota archaeon]